ncbi:ATP-dependent Clp protease proteolytic subunit [Jiella pacifica]|uniref:ATP-dependent Clp protease proteolytic subunit n=1 Tax=Jiella pacifica TaxID=2696469 RepID=A0A6N9T5V8_9HYPH|nr:ATP-dependent Clp protease proteolytic subunit [Jiella pacifica]NDW05446.1 hypothetical protein [Jiella pacifica]
MIGDETSPGRLERLVLKLPEGSVLRLVFLALLGVAGAMVALDYQDMAGRSAERERLSRTEPLPLRRPSPGDQIRPYLPRTIPVGPDRGEPTLPGYDGPAEGEALAAPMRFFVGPEGEATAIGRIEVGTGEALREFLASPAAEGVETLVLHSPGGSVADAMAMARDLRSQDISTRVPADGYCASACPLVLAGGLTRRAGENSWVGVHQVYAVSGAEPGLPSTVDRSIAEIQATTAECQTLLAEMGVDPALWIKAMQTPSASLYVLTPEELVEYRLVRPLPDGPSFVGPPAPSYPRFEPPTTAEAETDEKASTAAQSNGSLL